MDNNMKNKLLFFLLLGALSLAPCVFQACSHTLSPQEEIASRVGTFARGADVSWVTQMESQGITFKNRNGETKECMKLLKEDCNVDAIRLRVWVNPASGWNSIDDVLVKARRATALGLRVMIDFHFSDSWADPGQQTIPAAWASYDLTQMKAAVSAHVSEMLTKLKKAGVTPEWVQIGNETRNGMLWPLGKIDNGTRNFAELLNAGYDAVKAVFPNANVIVHVDNGNNQSLFAWVFGYLKDNGGKYDMIGMSLYPENGKGQVYANDCLSNINSLYTTYGKPVMLCEIGMDYARAEECRDCIATLMKEGQKTGRLKGIFYWEPEAPAGYNGGYGKGCFVNGAPTVALDAFKLDAFKEK